MYKIEYLRGANVNFEEIIKYYDDIDTDISDKVGGEILDCIESLETMPLRFPKHRQRPQYRWCGVHSYMIFYKVIEATKTVEIHRIIHGSRDVENII